MIGVDFRMGRLVAATGVLLAATACSHAPTHVERTPTSMTAVTPAPVTPAVESEPVEVNPPISPWQRLREGFAMLDCENNEAVLKEARRYTRNPQRFNENWRKALPLFLLVLEQIERHELPTEFALLPYVESHYRQLPRTGPGPAGMWQLMGRTAVDQGLKVSRIYDERLDPLASTAVVIALLERYDRQFSDWRLADMAFNAGEFRVKRALGRPARRKLDGNQLARLKLSSTTHQHLARLMALSCIIENPRRFSVSMPPLEAGAELQALTLPSAIDLRLAAALAGLPMDELLRFNAAWLGQMNPSGPTTRLLLPQRDVVRFNAGLAQIPDAMLSDWHLQSLDVATTVDALATRHKISPALLASANRLDMTQPLRPGIELLLPGRTEGSDTAVSAEAHTILRGDTLSAIAHRFGVRLADLLHWNGLTRKSILRPGATLRVRAPTL